MKTIVLVSTVLIVSALLGVWRAGYVLTTQFEQDSQRSHYLQMVDAQASDDQIRHLIDDFDYQHQYSSVIDEMESQSNWDILDGEGELHLSIDCVSGTAAVSFTVKSINDAQPVVFRKVFDHPIDLSRWNHTGVFSCWMKLDNATQIRSVGLQLFDDSHSRTYMELENLDGPPNELKINGFRPDYFLPPQEGGLNMWMDYQLVEGWNYLFWRADNYSGNSNLANVRGYQFHVTFRSSSSQHLVLDNFRVQDGVQIQHNPVGGNWYSPNGMPMYGVFDANAGYLRLLNVRQTQYISNGDHVRILSRGHTPLNFTMRVIFSVDGIHTASQNLENNYVRFAWDFVDEYDAGHDSFLAFISLQYNKFGLLTVYPIERYFKQGQEPTIFDAKSRVSFSLQEKQMYEIDITTIGQYTKATIYSLNGLLFKTEATVEYTFQRERSANHEAGHIVIESTGDIHFNLYKVEVFNLNS